MFDDGGGLKRKKKKEEADLDITPMIDVTFLLLIFFMVTSTMQGTPDKDIPPALSGKNENAAAFRDLTVLSPKSAGADSEMMLDGNPITLDELRVEVIQAAALATKDNPLKIMIYAERDVKSGSIGEVESVLNEVAAEEQAEIKYNFAVRDRR